MQSVLSNPGRYIIVLDTALSAEKLDKVPASVVRYVVNMTTRHTPPNAHAL
jgi:hypothetical protein